jgi:hypothetical protein
MRRHWITTVLASLCFATAAALVYSLCLLPLKPGAAENAPLHTAIWRILGLFPSPTSVSWVTSHVAGAIAPALVQSKMYSAVLNVLTLIFSVELGLSILRLRSWARSVLVSICALTAALQAFTLFQLVIHSRGLLTVLGSNYRSANMGYAGGGPGAILASMAISITLFRLLLRHGLPALAPPETNASVLSGGDSHAAPKEAKLQRANKFLLAATAGALLLDLVFLFGGLNDKGTSGRETRFLLYVMLVPHVIILIRSWRGPDRLSLGLAAGYGLVMAYMGAIFLPNFLFALAWIATPPRHPSDWLFASLELVPLIQSFAFVNALVATRLLPPSNPKSAQLGVWGLAFLIPVVLGTAGPQFFFDWQQGWLRVPGVKSWGDELKDLKNRDVVARELVHTYGRCAFLYAKTHPGTGFPENAALLGPGGTACLTKVEALGTPEGYSFRYAAAKSAGSARFDRFTAVAQLNWQHHFDAALMDEKGIFVTGISNVEQPHMVAADQISWDSPGIYKRQWDTSPGWMLVRIQACSTLLRTQSADSEFPAALAAILTVKEKPNDPDCLKVYGSGPDPILQAAANSNRVEHVGYILNYEPEREASGKVTHFYITLRPKRYAENSIRSYFMDDSGIIHATPEDRPAAPTDPAALPCELGEVCVNLPTP